MKDNADWRYEEAHILRHGDDGMSGTQWVRDERQCLSLRRSRGHSSAPIANIEPSNRRACRKSRNR